MQFDLPRHEQRTPLTAVLTAENLFAELVIAKSWIDYLEDISCLVGYYIINFKVIFRNYIRTFFYLFLSFPYRSPAQCLCGLARLVLLRRPPARSMTGLTADGQLKVNTYTSTYCQIMRPLAATKEVTSPPTEEQCLFSVSQRQRPSQALALASLIACFGDLEKAKP